MNKLSSIASAFGIFALTAGTAAAQENERTCIDLQDTHYDTAALEGDDLFLAERHNDLMLADTFHELNDARTMFRTTDPVTEICMALEADLDGEGRAYTVDVDNSGSLPFWKSIAREYLAFGLDSFINLNKQDEEGFGVGEEYYERTLEGTRAEALTIALSSSLDMQMNDLQGNTYFHDMIEDPMVAQTIRANDDAFEIIFEIANTIEWAAHDGETSITWDDLNERSPYLDSVRNKTFAPYRVQPLNGEQFFLMGQAIFGNDVGDEQQLLPRSEPETEQTLDL